MFVVGVDGSEASVEALRQAQRLAAPVGAKVLATAYWDDPQVYAGYVAMGIDRFEERVMLVLDDALKQAFGDDIPPNVVPRVVRGHPRDCPVLVVHSPDTRTKENQP